MKKEIRIKMTMSQARKIMEDFVESNMDVLTSEQKMAYKKHFKINIDGLIEVN